MTAREAAVIEEQGGMATARQSRELAQRLRYGQSILRLAWYHDSVAAREGEDDPRRVHLARHLLVHVFEKGLEVDIGPSTMDAVVQYPALHIALIEEHKITDLLLTLARNGVKLISNIVEDKNKAKGDEAKSFEAIGSDMTEVGGEPGIFLDIRTENARAGCNQGRNYRCEHRMSPIGSTASVNQSDHGRVENEGLDSQPEPSESEADNNETHQGQFPSPPRTPHRSLLQSIDPRSPSSSRALFFAIHAKSWLE